MSLNEAITAVVRIQTTRKGITLADLAKTLGKSRTTFWDRLSGRRAWDTEDFESLAAALGMESSWQLLDAARNEQQSALAGSTLERAS